MASILILPIVVLLSFGFEQIMATFYISIYSLPFNLLVILFLYALRFRTQRATNLREVIIQQGTPEKNLYLQTNYVTRMRSSGILSISLPVMGEWKISQGYNGKYTHKDDWRHALDFVISDNEGKEYKNKGLVAEDYYCFAKNVISPADGYIVELADGIEDNAIGDMNLINNWGNSIVIQLASGLYAQLSHIKSGTFKINKGDYVKKGQLIGQVGNSGRSPYPHLHFQIQNAPHIGAKTIDYPLVNYLSNKDDLRRYHAYGRPTEGESLSNVVATPIMANAFRFTPGQKYTFRFSFPNGKGDVFQHFEEEYLLEVNSDIYKNTYFECKKTGEKAWFYNDGQVFHFSNYIGNRKSFLFYYMLALFKVELGYTQNISIKDQIPVHFTFSGVQLFVQDFLAPFFQYLKSNYQMKFVSIDDDFSPQKIHFQTDITNRFGSRELEKNTFDIHVKEAGIHQISINISGKQAIGACVKRG